MSISNRESRISLNSSRSHLGKTLLQLHQSLEEARENDIRQEEQFEEWQKTWKKRRDQISRKLKTLQLQLDALTQEANPPVQLAVVSHHAETKDFSHEFA